MTSRTLLLAFPDRLVSFSPHLFPGQQFLALFSKAHLFRERTGRTLSVWVLSSGQHCPRAVSTS